MPDAELDRLVQAGRSGDGEAYGQLWRRLSGQVAGYLRGHRVADVDDPHERGLPRLLPQPGVVPGRRGGLPPLPVLRRATAVHRLGTPARDGWTGDLLRPERDPRAPSSAEDDHLDHRARQDVTELLATLTCDQRDVLLLRYVADLTAEQVARIVVPRG